MNKPDKSITHFEPEKGQRRLLSGDKVGSRCPFFGTSEKEKRHEVIEPILINLISYIIEKEIETYLNTLYAEE